MNKTNMEISSLIAKEFDTRMETSVFSFILDNGIESLKEMTEDEISKIEGNNFMTSRFAQSLVRTSVKICKGYTPIEIMQYIRAECYFNPFPREVTLYKDYFKGDGWEYLCSDLDADVEEEEIAIIVIKADKA